MAKKARVVLDTSRAQPNKPATGAANAEGAAQSAAAAEAQAKKEMQAEGTTEGTRRRGKRTTPKPKPEEATGQQPPPNAQSALISLLTKAKNAGDTMDDPNYLKEQISKYQVLYPDMGADEFLAALTKVDPTGVNQGAYNYLKPEGEAVAAEGGNPPPPPPASAVADSGTQTNLQDGVVTSSDDSLDPVTDEQGELTSEEVAARLGGMLGDATAPTKIAVTSTKFPSYGDDATPLPRRAAQPTPEQAAANVAGEAAAADAAAPDADTAAEIARLSAALDAGTATLDDYRRLETLTGNGDDLNESDLQQIVGDIELDESVVDPPAPFQPNMPVPPEAQLGPRTEPALPYPMDSINVGSSLPMPAQPIDLSGLTNPLQSYRVETNLMGMPEGSEPVDVQAYLKALLTDKNLIADSSLQADPRFGQDRNFEPVVPDMSGVQRGQPIDRYTVGRGMNYDTPTVAQSTTRTDVTSTPRVPTSSIRKLIDAANKNRVVAGGLGAMGLLGGMQAYNIATRQPPEEAQPVVNLAPEDQGLTPDEFALRVQQRRKARQQGAGGLMTNVMEDRP